MAGGTSPVHKIYERAGLYGIQKNVPTDTEPVRPLFEELRPPPPPTPQLDQIVEESLSAIKGLLEEQRKLYTIMEERLQKIEQSLSSPRPSLPQVPVSSQVPVPVVYDTSKEQWIAMGTVAILLLILIAGIIAIMVSMTTSQQRADRLSSVIISLLVNKTAYSSS
jgi:hypothetical protein